MLKFLKVQELDALPGCSPVLGVTREDISDPLQPPTRRRFRLSAVIGVEYSVDDVSTDARAQAEDLARRHLAKQVYGRVDQLVEEILFQGPSREIVEICYKILEETRAP